MKKVVVLGLAAALCVACRVFGAEKSGAEEFRAVSAGGLDNAAKIAAYKDIAKRCPEMAASAANVSAWLYYADGKVSEALAAVEAGIRDYPGSTNDVVSMTCCKAACLMREDKNAEALEALAGCLRDYPGVGGRLKASVKRTLASLYFYKLNDPAAAISLVREAVDLLPPEQKSLEASLSLAYMLKQTGAGSECSAVCQAAVLKNAAVVGGTEEMDKAFSQVDAVALGVEKYKEFLNGVLLRVPAVEANAKFLGRVKSELEKIK